MKFRRTVSLFLLTVLLTGLCLTPRTVSAEPLDVKATAALLVDLNGDVVLYEKNAGERRYPASITKVMTALLVLEAVDSGKLSLTQEITASETALMNLDSYGSSADIKPGEIMTVKDLLYCMLLVSANESCNILAEAVDGSVDAFVAHMNRRAEELGCEDTHFTNTHGLHNPDHYTTAWDIYLLAREAIKNDTLMALCNTLSYDVPATNMSESRELHTTNSLISNWKILGYLYEGASGIKTGTTDEAGHCLVSSASRQGRTMICVVLGCEGSGDTVESFSETARLYDYGFDNFSLRTVLREDDLIQEVPVSLSKENSAVVVHPAQDTMAILPNDVNPEDLERTVTLRSETAMAPITAGDVLGEITLSYEGRACATVDLLAQYDVTASRFLTVKYHVIQFFHKTVVQVILIVLAVLVIALIVWLKVLRPRRRYSSHRRPRNTRRVYHGRRHR